jgi:hypothetical protein
MSPFLCYFAIGVLNPRRRGEVPSIAGGSTERLSNDPRAEFGLEIRRSLED